MSRAQTTVIRVGLFTFLAALAAFVLSISTGDSRPADAKGAGAATLPFANAEPAKNPEKLQLLVDETKVVGWISGHLKHFPESVRIKVNDKTEEIQLQGDTFTWPYEIAQPTEAELSCWNGQARFPHLTQRITLLPRTKREPTVFFVVDRSLYRPGQPLHFSGFLRKQDEKGELVPLANESVEVRITSEQKNTIAGRVSVTSDDRGKIVGSYPFVDADARDNYTLSIPKYRGTAKVAMGEYRKSKIKLKITGNLDDGKMRLKFEAVDFLDKPIGGSRVQFTAQVVRQANRTDSGPLKTTDYVFHQKNELDLPNLEGLTEEEILFWEATGQWVAAPSLATSMVLAQYQGEVKLNNKEPGEHLIAVSPDWLDGKSVFIVQGVLIDENGREQRATQAIPVDVKPTTPAKMMKLSVPRQAYEVGEKITVTADLMAEKGKKLKGTSSLVVMQLLQPEYKLRSNTYQGLLDLGTPNGGFYGGGHWPPNGGFRPRGGYRGIDYGLLNPEPAERLRQQLHDSVPFQGNQANLKLDAPGAYKLIAITHLADGRKLRDEVNISVRAREHMPALSLHLDKSDYNSGDTLSGTIQSRFANAQVLLTIRDSVGLRFWKPLLMNGTVHSFKQELPSDLHYGCTVEVQYMDEADRVHLASKSIRVNPVHRQLTIQTSMKEVCAPGEKVKIDVQVNRKEEVDLVVSVYDQSLLGIAPDRQIDPRNFYFADDSAGQVREMLRRKLGTVTVKELLQKARHWLATEKPQPPGVGISMAWIEALEKGNGLALVDVSWLLLLAGVEVRQLPWHHGGWHFVNADGKLLEKRLFDILQTNQPNGWRLGFRMFRDCLLISETHPTASVFAGYTQSQNTLLERFDRADYKSRGDAHYSTSGNSSHSFTQPQGAPAVPEILPLNPDQGAGTALVRRDFSDLAFWKADVRTDKDGKASVEFKLPDSLTNWQVVVTAISKDLHVGQHKSRFQTFKPIMVWPMLPRIFSQGDKVAIYASVHNRTDERQWITVRLKADNGTILTAEETSLWVGPKSSAPVYWTFQPKTAGFTELLMTAECQAGADASLKRLPVTSIRAEQDLTLSGYCRDAVTLKLPDGVDLKTAQLEITFSPSLVADMTDTLNYLVEYPHGCVEQTMSRFLPAIKVAQVLKQFQINHPELQKKLPNCVEGGIKRLLELQQPDGGWGWHGGSQTHEMMTPYALYGLLQAEKAGYRLPREDAIAKGLARLKTFIDAMGDAQVADRIYCMYVYSHRETIPEDWWKVIEKQREGQKLSDYALALALEMAVQQKQDKLATKLATSLKSRAVTEQQYSYWRTAGFSRWGDDRFEVTAAAMKALVAFDHDDKLISQILTFFAIHKRGNRWNSTKDTAMIVYALCDYLAKQDYTSVDKHVATFEVNEANTTRVSFEDGLNSKVVVPNKHLRKGDNTISFVSSSPGVMYRAVLRYWQEGAELPPAKLGITVGRTYFLLDAKGTPIKQLKSGDAVPRGSYIMSQVAAYELPPGVAMNYALMEDPKPSGCEIQPIDDRRFPQQCTPYALREEKEGLVAYHHEQASNGLLNQCILHCEMAGEFLVPPAQVELMYQTNIRGHSGTFFLKVVEPDKQSRGIMKRIERFLALSGVVQK